MTDAPKWHVEFPLPLECKPQEFEAAWKELEEQMGEAFVHQYEVWEPADGRKLVAECQGPRIDGVECREGWPADDSLAPHELLMLAMREQPHQYIPQHVVGLAYNGLRSWTDVEWQNKKKTRVPAKPHWVGVTVIHGDRANRQGRLGLATRNSRGEEKLYFASIGRQLSNKVRARSIRGPFEEVALESLHENIQGSWPQVQDVLTSMEQRFANPWRVHRTKDAFLPGERD